LLATPGWLERRPGRIDRVRPSGLERKPVPRLPGGARLLRRLPDPRAMIALPLGMVAILAALMALTGQGADSVLRHLYLVPTIWVALGRGTVGGGLVGSLAGLLHAPIVLPAVERHGITSQTLDGLLSLGLPALALPCGVSADGRPLALQIVGRPFDEATVLRLGHAYQGATAWHEVPPSVQGG